MINNESDINLRKIKIKTFLIQEFWEEIKLCNPEKKNQQLMFAIAMSAYPSVMSAYPSEAKVEVVINFVHNLDVPRTT